MVNIKKKSKVKVSLICGLWVLICLSSLVLNIYVRHSLKDQALDLIKKVSLEASLSINDAIKNKFTVLETVTKSIDINNLSEPEKVVETFSDIIRENGFSQMGIAKLDGISYCNNGDIIDVSEQDYFKEALAGEKFVSTMVFSNSNTKRKSIFSVPIIKKNKVVAALWNSVLSEYLYEKIDLHSMNTLVTMSIVDINGDVIVSNNKRILEKDNFNLFETFNEEIHTMKNDLNTSMSGSIELSSSVSIYYSKLDYSNWWLISIMSDDSVNQYYDNIIKRINISNIVVILVITVVCLALFRIEKRNYKILTSVAYTDNVTGGKNDLYLRNNIIKYFNKNDKFAFISLEITNIRNIITVFGIGSAKDLIKQLYCYLEGIIGDGEVVIHNDLGEFKLLLKYDIVEQLLERIEHISFQEIDSNIKFIMGIYLIDNFEESYDNIVSYTSIAKETIDKKESNYMIYNKYIHKKEIEKINLEESIGYGIKNKEFRAWFQPQYGEDGKTIVGAESLVRWHKQDKIMSPYIFIPTCEANGLIKEIDLLVLEDVCRCIKKWINEGKKVVPISVNLSRSYLDKVDSMNLLERLLEKYEIPKDLIQFEITESSLIGNEENLKKVVEYLHKKGFKVLVDDFGVGYSSIKAISFVNFDILKIDKSFTDEIGDKKWEKIIMYTIDMAKSLGMGIIVEGVETKKQYEFLLRCGCKMFQGYYFNKPMDEDSFSNLIT